MKQESSQKSISFGRRVDFHTHILPGMDDGSTSVEMSMQMIQESIRQGVCGIVLTPHFYATRDYPGHFLKKRESRLQLLKQNCPYRIPLIIAGAEVQYFEGITAMRDLPKMRIEKSSGLLVEMPMGKWSNRIVSDILDLNSRREYQVVLAHVERYLPFGNLQLIRRLADSGVLMQVSSGAFDGFLNLRKMLQLLDEGLVHLLGSDCHNLTSRPPNLADAYNIIEMKRGKEAVKRIVNNGIRLLASQQNESRQDSQPEYI